MHSLLIFPKPAPAQLTKALERSGYSWTAVANAEEAARQTPVGGWSGAIIAADEDAERAFSFARELRKSERAVQPVILLISGHQLAELELRSELFDDFCLSPFQALELEARLKHLWWQAGHGGSRHQLVEYGPLVLDVDTYQATVDGEGIELTYMEYELLKFLASHPGQVFTRETLLSRVWGYDYFGGARTVDVHVRRLRSKLGEEHAGLIQTIRSVGYSLGERRAFPSSPSA